MARAIAICEGGPIGGAVFSVEVDQDGTPEPLHSRAELLGVLYRPVSPTDLTEELSGRFYSDLHGGIEHGSAWIYAAEEAT
jgi:hypothetical protein